MVRLVVEGQRHPIAQHLGERGVVTERPLPACRLAVRATHVRGDDLAVADEHQTERGRSQFSRPVGDVGQDRLQVTAAGNGAQDAGECRLAPEGRLQPCLDVLRHAGPPSSLSEL